MTTPDERGSLFVNADWSALVPAGSPDAAFGLTVEDAKRRGLVPLVGGDHFAEPEVLGLVITEPEVVVEPTPPTEPNPPTEPEPRPATAAEEAGIAATVKAEAKEAAKPADKAAPAPANKAALKPRSKSRKDK